MGLARRAVDGLLHHFTTDLAVRAGVTTAAWSASASFARGMLPRTPVQQAAATGVVIAAHYQLGATTWASISSTAAGLPGHRPGTRALLTAAAVSAAGGKVAEVRLRPRASESLAFGSAWSAAKLLSVIGMSGGLATASDVLARDVLDLPRTPATTLALDLAMGAAMASGTIARRRRRTRRYLGEGPEHTTVEHPRRRPGQNRNRLVQQARSGVYVGSVAVGSAVGLGVLAVGEQAAARQVARAVNAATGSDLAEFGDLLGHLATFGVSAVGSIVALRALRVRVEQRAAVIEPAYEQAPDSPFVSCGPVSRVPFDAVGKEGRRFVLMRLTAREIEDVTGRSITEPVRVIVPNEGSVDARVELAIAELATTGGLDRSLICVASPTGVGYVNYVMAEALEYLTGGDCAIVVPQYAYLPSALALDRTVEGTKLQRAVIAGIRAELDRRGTGATMLVQYGESLGAQVAADVGGDAGVRGFDEVRLDGGLYLGVPFRSSLWRAYLRNPEQLSRGGRLVNAPDAESLPEGRRRHVMINHNDDPINKFAYTMVVQPPWWMGPAHTRPPLVPRETYFRPITTFVLGLVDLLNGMNMRPGEFRRVGHDYRYDMREAVQKAYSLPVDPDQAIRIEAALRAREQEWAERRLIASTADKALRAVRDTINSWGRNAVNVELDEQAGDTTPSRLVEYLSSRLGSISGGLATEEDAERDEDEDEAQDQRSSSSSSSSM